MQFLGQICCGLLELVLDPVLMLSAVIVLCILHYRQAKINLTLIVVTQDECGTSVAGCSREQSDCGAANL